MKIKWIAVLFLSLVLALSGCRKKEEIIDDDNDDDQIITLSEVKTLLFNTKNTFLSSSNLNIALETEVNDEIASLSLSYEINGFTIENFKYKTELESKVYEVYIKDDIQYMNFNNQKSKKVMDGRLSRKIISEYSFNTITNVFYNIHTEAYFNGLKVDSEVDGLVRLSLDNTKVNEEMLSYLSEELFSGEEVISIRVEIDYENNSIMKIESFIGSKNGQEVRFLLNLYAGGFEYPSDLDTYASQA